MFFDCLQCICFRLLKINDKKFKNHFKSKSLFNKTTRLSPVRELKVRTEISSINTFFFSKCFMLQPSKKFLNNCRGCFEKFYCQSSELALRRRGDSGSWVRCEKVRLNLIGKTFSIGCGKSQVFSSCKKLFREG